MAVQMEQIGTAGKIRISLSKDRIRKIFLNIRLPSKSIYRTSRTLVVQI